MRCPNCGEELDPGNVFCKKCGQEMQMVPDYDPLDELTIGDDSQTKIEDQIEDKKEEEEKGSSQKEEAKKQYSIWRRIGRYWRIWLMLGGILICFVIFLYFYFSFRRENDFNYQLKTGIELMEEERYEEALSYLKHAQSLQSNTEGADTKPLRCQAEIYVATGAKELAVECMKDAILIEAAARGENYELLELYQELMDILNETNQTGQIEEVIKGCEYEKIRENLLPYRIEKPVCDIPEGTYSYYLSLELTAPYGMIYYTLDGTAPTADSTLYEGKIGLMSGETLLRAVAINKKGMVSDELVLVYKLEFKENSILNEEEL